VDFWGADFGLFRGLVGRVPWESVLLKAHLELNLATAVKDNTKCFYKYINDKRRPKDNLHHLLDAG